jgi:hypothetical protein
MQSYEQLNQFYSVLSVMIELINKWTSVANENFSICEISLKIAWLLVVPSKNRNQRSQTEVM